MVDGEHDAARARNAVEPVVAQRHVHAGDARSVTRPTPHGVDDRHIDHALSDEPLDALDDVVDGEIGGVDLHRVGGGAHVDRVALVAHAQVGRERIGAEPGPVGRARWRDFRVSDEVHLDHVGRRDHRADVTALDDRVALVGERRRRSRMTSRTGGWRATTGTSLSMPGLRIDAVTSASSM